MNNHIYLPDVVGKGYSDFWHSKHRFRVVKGSRASKKSTTTALNFIYRLIKYPNSNLLVVRKTYRSLKDSTFSQLIWAIEKLGVSEYFEINKSPLELTYKHTGQKIFFRGLDDPLKITSIIAPKGYLCWIWIEEAYEIEKEEDFDTLVECIRGDVGEKLFKQITVTFNPWNEHHWLKKRFFDDYSNEVFATTTNYLCNEWLDKSDLTMFENMRYRNPERYNVAGLGNWGIASGLVYSNFKNENIVAIDGSKKFLSTFIGVDYGNKNATTFILCGIGIDKNFYVLDEYYHSGKEDTVKSPITYGKDFIRWYKSLNNNFKTNLIGIYIDPSALSFNQTLKELGVSNIKSAKNDVNNGISYMQSLIECNVFYVNDKCKNVIKELYSYVWDTKISSDGKYKPIKEYDHTLDAIRYVIYSNKKIWKSYISKY